VKELFVQYYYIAIFTHEPYANKLSEIIYGRRIDWKRNSPSSENPGYRREGGYCGISSVKIKYCAARHQHSGCNASQTSTITIASLEDSKPHLLRVERRKSRSSLLPTVESFSVNDVPAGQRQRYHYTINYAHYFFQHWLSPHWFSIIFILIKPFKGANCSIRYGRLHCPEWRSVHSPRFPLFSTKKNIWRAWCKNQGIGSKLRELWSSNGRQYLVGTLSTLRFLEPLECIYFRWLV